MKPQGDLNHVRYEAGSGVAHLVLNRPDRRNALGLGPGSSRDEIRTALGWADQDADVRCVLISAEGDTFCAGGDLALVAGPLSVVDDEALIQEVDAFHAAVRSVSKPVIAAVQGHCLGAGVGFVIQCDFVLAADDASFGLPEGRFGHPGGAELAGVVGPAWAKFMIFTGESLNADQAVRCGLALFVIRREELLQKSTELAHRIARLPEEALRLNKRSIQTATEASGRAAGRLAGRAVDLLTKTRSHEAKAPDGRAFESILTDEGVAGLTAAKREQFSGSWIRSLDGTEEAVSR